MANLFWKTKQKTKILLSTPFKTEEEFEKIVFNTHEILEDIFLIKRQIRRGNKPGIPDIVGIDNDGNVCIIEMKNVTVDASIIPQVLQYAFWAETNPDSIKSLWLECENKPDELSISWDDFQVRIIIIAPSILKSTLSIVEKINYPVDLIEIKRWVDGDNQLLLANKLENDKIIKPKTVSGLPSAYDEEFYEKEFNKESAKEFMEYTKEIESIVKEKGWSLETKYNKHYCGFKAGFFLVFGIEWMGSKTFAFFIKLDEKQANSMPIKMTKYASQWKQAYYYIKPGETKTKDFIPLFEMAYKKFAGD
jgi:hypothetical protein